jgi:SAM-dependent methyltransferase
MELQHLNTPILNQRKRADLHVYLERCSRFTGLDVSQAYALTIELGKFYNHGGGWVAPWMDLKDRWYRSILNGSTGADFSVYEDHVYLSDIWICWVKYSSQYLKDLAKLLPITMPNLQSILDLGCGFGYTTAALKQLCPGAIVVGTNLPSTAQFQIAQDVGLEYGFTVEETFTQPAELVFASEYFEHFQAPIQHLEEILRVASPKYLVCANSFNTDSIGHFLDYSGTPAHLVGRQFNAVLRGHGYQQVETGFWNHRPALWAIEP